MKTRLLLIWLIFLGCATMPDIITKPKIKEIDRLIEQKKKLPDTLQNRTEIEILESVRQNIIDTHKVAVKATHEAKKNQKAAGQVQGFKWGLIGLLGVAGLVLFIWIKFF